MLGLGNTLSGSIVPAVVEFLNTYSLEFDGTDDYVTMGDSDTFSFGDASTDSAFSCSAWINMDGPSKFRIMSKSVFGDGNIEWIFTTSAGYLLSLYLYDNVGTQHIVRHSANISAHANSWIHVAATYSGGGNNTDIHLYIDGANADDSVSTAGSYTAMHNSAGSLDIGRFARSASSVDYADGTIDEASLWNKELSAAEVAAIHNSGVPTDLSGESNLVGYWRMEENTGTSVADSSSNSNAATLVNGTAFDSDTP